MLSNLFILNDLSNSSFIFLYNISLYDKLNEFIIVINNSNDFILSLLIFCNLLYLNIIFSSLSIISSISKYVI